MIKDPDAKLPYTVDWSPWLAGEGDTIASVTWIVPDGITKESSPAASVVDGKATAWFSGGTAGVNYSVTCRVTTTGGRINDQTLPIKVRNR